MKRLSDYKDEEAIELWADLFDPITDIIADAETRNMLRKKGPVILKAKELLKKHSTEVKNVLLRIDPTPLNGFNIMVRLVSILNEITDSPEIQSFFESSAGEEKAETSSGNVTENTEDNLGISSNM